MKVLNISTYDYEGAASATYRLHRNLLANNIESKMLVSKKTKNDDTLIEIERTKFNRFKNSLFDKLDGKLKIYRGKYNFIDKQRYVNASSEEIIKKLDFKPTIIVLHWISNFLSLKVIYELQQYYNAKVFWYQMDMAPMTGGCHYAWDCTGYQTDCSNCPAIRWIKQDSPMKFLEYKKKYIDLMNITPITGGKFVQRQVESSYLFKNQTFKKVMLGLDSNLFKPSENVIELKKKYNLNETNKRIVFFPSYDIRNERKGFKYLLNALEILENKNPETKDTLLLLTAGHVENKILSEVTTYEVRHLGYLDSDKKLTEAYQLADLFISASIEDSGPMMVAESILSGVPVLAFNMGLAEDLITDGITGYVAELKNSNDLMEKLQCFLNLNNKEIEVMKNNCYSLGLKELTYETQLNYFIKAIK